MAIHHGIAPISVFGLGFTPEIWVFSSPFLVIICEGPHYLVTITFSSPDSFMSYCFLITSLKTCECYGSFLFCASLSLLTLALRPLVLVSWTGSLSYLFSWLWCCLRLCKPFVIMTGIQVSICSHRHFRKPFTVPVLSLVVVAFASIMPSMCLNAPSTAISLLVFNIAS